MNPWTVACQTPLFMEFPRQEYWSGLPFPIPRDLPNTGIEPVSLASPALVDRFLSSLPPGKHIYNILTHTYYAYVYIYIYICVCVCVCVCVSVCVCVCINVCFYLYPQYLYPFIH